MPLTVLIVDDDERFRELVKRLLGPGVRVVGEAARGDDAVLLATEVRPDVVLMDLEIPDLDGIAATRQIRAVVGRFGSAWDGMERRGPGVTWGRWHGSERRRPRPSGETGEPVKEPSTLRRPKELLERVARKASLVFDSFRQPLPAGVRVIGPSARRLLYKAGRYRVRLRLEPGADSDRLSLVGQVLDEGVPKKPLHDLAVLVSSGGKTVDRTLTNRFGEFLLQPDPAMNLQLSVEAPEIGSFIVSVPSVERAGGRGRRTNVGHGP